MSSSVHQNPSLSIPPTQNTAPVLEFNCLYTHDIRRKQKRWQDGFLRFHTFNKRVMVYDVPRNFIGDMHWQSGGDLAEGDEVMLEKDGVVVQVAEQVGATQTDLTEIRASVGRKKKEERVGEGSSPIRTAGPMATPSRSNMALPASRAGNGTQLKHRSLNALFGTPRGQLGKAASPGKSPFEERQEAENEQWEGGRPPKRQRTEAWNITRTTSALTPKPAKETPLLVRTSDAKKAATAKAKKQKTALAGRQRLGTREVIELSDDGDETSAQFLTGFLSDALAPPTSPARQEPPFARKVLPAQIAATAANKTVKQGPTVRSSSPALQTQNAQLRPRTGKTPTPLDDSVQCTTTERAKSKKSIASRTSPEPPQAIAPPFLPLPPSTRASQTLRIATAPPKKKTLACLDQLVAKPENRVSRPTSPEANAPKRRKTQKQLVEERLAKMKQRAQERANDLNDLVDDADAIDDALPFPGLPRTRPQTDRPQTPVTELTSMDQILLQPQPASPPRTIPQPAVKPERRDRAFQRVVSEPVPTQPEIVQRKDRTFQRVISEHGSAAAPTKSNRVPGAPVRYTPSPTQRSVASDSDFRRGLTYSVQSPTQPPPVLLDMASPILQQEHAVPVADRAKADPAPATQEFASATSKPPVRHRGVTRKDIRKSVQAALDTSANGTSTVILSRPFQAPKAAFVAGKADKTGMLASAKPPPTAREAGPWSRDAFDLFEWRPPGWDEEEWKLTPAAPD